MNKYNDIGAVNRRLRENQDQTSDFKRRLLEIEHEQDECWNEYHAAIKNADRFMDYSQGIVFQKTYSEAMNSLQALSRKVEADFQMEKDQAKRELQKLSNEEDELLRQKSVLVREEDKNGR